MKNTYYAAILSVIAACTVTFASCGNPAAADKTSGLQATTTADENAKTVYGEIYEVIGNMVTLKVIETPADGMFNGGGMRDFQMPTNEDGSTMSRDEMRANMGSGERINMPTNEDGSTMSREEMMERFQSEGGFATRRNMGDGEAGIAQMPTNENGEIQMPTNEDGSVTFRKAETKYTGEQIDIIIPVGIPITQSSYGEGGVTESEVKLDSLKAGNKLYVTYAADGVTVSKVSVMPDMNGAIVRNFEGFEGGEMPPDFVPGDMGGMAFDIREG